MLRAFSISAASLALVACSAVLGLSDYEPTGTGGSSVTGVAGGGQGGTAGGGAGGAAEPWFGRHAQRKRLVLDTTIVEADMQDFPTPIIIAADEALSMLAQPDGRDIAFTAADRVTKLSHEIEHYDRMTGALVAWVQLPSIQAASTTELYLYFGDVDDGDQQDLAGTWPAGRYRGVWHLSDDPAGAPPQMADSSTYGSDGEALNMALPATGVAAAAIDFDGVASRVVIPDDDQLDLDPAGFSYTCWVKSGDSTVGGGRPLYKVANGAPGRGYMLRLGDGPWHAQLFDGENTMSLHLGGEASYIDTWTHLAMVVDPGTGFVVAYVNGMVSESRAIDTFDLAAMSNDQPLYFSAGGGSFLGAVDEVRLYGAALTEDWVALEHHALTSPNYLTVEAIELAP